VRIACLKVQTSFKKAVICPSDKSLLFAGAGDGNQSAARGASPDFMFPLARR